MIDKERILSKLAELDSYVEEIKKIMPRNFSEYKTIEKKRACERLLHLSIECVIDVCSLLVKGLDLGIPSEEDDMFEKLEKKVITTSMKNKLKLMKGFRNILVHKYSKIDDRIVYKNMKNINDFYEFKKQITVFLRGK